MVVVLAIFWLERTVYTQRQRPSKFCFPTKLGELSIYSSVGFEFECVYLNNSRYRPQIVKISDNRNNNKSSRPKTTSTQLLLCTSQSLLIQFSVSNKYYLHLEYQRSVSIYSKNEYGKWCLWVCWCSTQIGASVGS